MFLTNHTHPSAGSRRRPVSTGMRTLLYGLTALTFVVGTQLVVLAEHTAAFFSWTIAQPMSAAFIGAGFWSAATVVFWASRQRDWVRTRMIVPTVAVVATMLLIATVQHLEEFHGAIGLGWIEVYAIFPPLLGALTVMQLGVPGRDLHSGTHLPSALRLVLAAQALVAVGVGVALFAAAGSAVSWWPWELTDLTSKAVGTWLVGTGMTCGFVAAVDDREVLPGWALAQVVLGGGVLLNLARFGGGIDLGSLGALLLIGYFAGTLASGACGAWLAWREGRFAPTPRLGGIPVEIRPPRPSLSHSSLFEARTMSSAPAGEEE